MSITGTGGSNPFTSVFSYWKTSNQLDTYKAKGPHKQRYTVKGHSLSTHVCNSHLEVDTSLDTSDTRNVQPKNSLVYGCSRVTLSGTKWWIRSPSHTGPLFYQSTQQQQSQPPRQYPEGNVIHSGERHIGCSDHYGNKPVSKTTHKRGHYHKEQHQQTVRSNQYVVELSISSQNTGSCVTLLHTNLQTHCCSNHSSPAGKDKVQHTNVFSVGTTAPTQELIFQIRFSFHIFLCVFFIQ